MGHVTMSTKEVKRLPVIMKVISKEMSQTEASIQLKLSTRQIRRFMRRVELTGAAGICHRSRAKQSPRKRHSEVSATIVGLCKRDYAGFGPTLAQEKLLERNNIQISRESLRQLLILEGLWASHKKRDKALHVWRERRGCEGELIQMDGSHHRWLEDRLDQSFCLMAYIDDATSQVYGRFYEYEGIYPVFDSFQRFIQLYGKPESVYSDRHSTYKITRKASVDEDLDGQSSQTQFQRVMGILDIEAIFAQSPQAKGRVERLFHTLQDRLVKEMRLEKISSIEDANHFLERFLPTYNQRFSVPARDPRKRWRSLDASFDKKWTFSVREARTILKNYTVQFRNRLFRIKTPSLALQGQRVEVLQSLDGELRFTTKFKRLEVEEITALDPKFKKEKKQSLSQSLKNLRDFTRSEDSSKKSWMDDIHFNKKVTVAA
jgi:hypothetical protein